MELLYFFFLLEGSTRRPEWEAESSSSSGSKTHRQSESYVKMANAAGSFAYGTLGVALASTGCLVLWLRSW